MHSNTEDSEPGTRRRSRAGLAVLLLGLFCACDTVRAPATLEGDRLVQPPNIIAEGGLGAGVWYGGVDRSYDDPRPRRRLFHVANDPDEQTDLTPTEPEIAQRLQAALHRLHRGYAARSLAPAENALDEMDRDRLRALGYLE